MGASGPPSLESQDFLRAAHRSTKRKEGVDCGCGDRTGTIFEVRAGHAVLSDCSTNQGSAFIAVPLPFQGGEDRIWGSAILECQSVPGERNMPSSRLVQRCTYGTSPTCIWKTYSVGVTGELN